MEPRASSILRQVPYYWVKAPALYLASFTLFHKSMLHLFIPYYDWVIFHCMDRPHFIYPFVFWWPLRLSLSLAIVDGFCCDCGCTRSFCVDAFFGEITGPMVPLHLTLWGVTLLASVLPPLMAVLLVPVLHIGFYLQFCIKVEYASHSGMESGSRGDSCWIGSLFKLHSFWWLSKPLRSRDEECSHSAKCPEDKGTVFLWSIWPFPGPFPHFSKDTER